ncbi:MAG: PBSX family phage terminase large subunit [Oscillospiraceae bacterium]|nr:PBSX family phage terminase large subunit [Oscillospiraceae bacterium]
MRFDRFSQKQLLAMRWWALDDYRDCDALICDGAVRSGKTLSMSLGFVCWAMACFDGGSFAICGKTITSLERNLVRPLLQVLEDTGFSCVFSASRHYVDVKALGHTGRFYLFGGKDEGSAALIQGMTLCGVLFDETALMPRSFVEQALARCSVAGAKLWFNCNPSHPYHWFYREWILQAQEKRVLYLHFTMDDNPSLSESVKERYRRMYAGVFYDRFVLGKWTASEGLVYPMFRKGCHVVKRVPECRRYVISCDYGTVNPTSMGLWGECDGTWYRLREYYYDARREGLSRTDEEHYRGLETLAGDLKIDCVVVDPSAASFIACIASHKKFRVQKAKNDVLMGIRQVSDALQRNLLRIHEGCEDILREFTQYCWNESAVGDAPKKEHDHAMDDMRYFVSTVLCGKQGDAFAVLSVTRQSGGHPA